jgi:hypothetical protein
MRDRAKRWKSFRTSFRKMLDNARRSGLEMDVHSGKDFLPGGR